MISLALALFSATPTHAAHPFQPYLGVYKVIQVSDQNCNGRRGFCRPTVNKTATIEIRTIKKGGRTQLAMDFFDATGMILTRYEINETRIEWDEKTYIEETFHESLRGPVHQRYHYHHGDVFHRLLSVNEWEDDRKTIGFRINRRDHNGYMEYFISWEVEPL